MSPKRKRLVIALVAGILAMQLGFTLALLVPDGIRVHWPDSKLPSARAFEATGNAWMAPGRGAVESIEVLATPADQDLSPAERKAGTVRVPGTLTWIKDRGKPLYPLQFWTAPIELPAAGEWELVATARDASGREICSEARRFTVDEVPPRAFVAWSAQHLGALGHSKEDSGKGEKRGGAPPALRDGRSPSGAPSKFTRLLASPARRTERGRPHTRGRRAARKGDAGSKPR